MLSDFQALALLSSPVFEVFAISVGGESGRLNSESLEI